MTMVPRVYAHHQPLPPLSMGPRVVALFLSAICFAVLIVAARLHPDPSGVETHLQLGLPPCGMLRTTGVPCIACGMTTSFAHLAHGHVLASLATQPAGTVFAFLTAVGAWVGLYIGVTAKPSVKLLNALPVHRWMLVLLGVAVVGWAYKIVVVWHAGHA